MYMFGTWAIHCICGSGTKCDVTKRTRNSSLSFLKEHLCFIALCVQTSYILENFFFSFLVEVLTFFEGNTCSGFEVLCFWYGWAQIALMETSTELLWEHRSLSYLWNEEAGVNESRIQRQRQGEEEKKIYQNKNITRILLQEKTAAIL